MSTTIKKIKPLSAKDRGMDMKEWEQKKTYPCLNISLEHLPEAKQWEPGETYKVTMELKMTGLHLGDKSGSMMDDQATFDITGLGIESGAAKPKKPRY